MHAVIRETAYSPDLKLANQPAFKEFQARHADRAGYLGTIVTHLGGDRYITVTLWDGREDMDAAREALSSIVDQLLNPLMAAPSKLHGTGVVAFTDLEV